MEKEADEEGPHTEGEVYEQLDTSPKEIPDAAESFK